MKKIYFAMLAASLACLPGAFAQQNTPLGYIVRQAEFKITDMYELARFDRGLGTARSAAMAGAFTSLGADLSSMNINPAGLGMYRTSEFGITGGLMITGTKNSVPGAFSTSASRASVGMNNIGVAFNVFEGTGSLTSFTMGFGYNKFADFNQRGRIDHSGSNTTILKMFAPVVANYAAQVGHDVLGGNGPWDGFDGDDAYLEEWGAILAYKTGLVRRVAGTDLYDTPGLADDASIGQSLETLSRGNAGEFTFSGGWNFSNKFYLGLTVAITEYYRNREVTFGELYADNNPVSAPAATSMLFVQNIRTTGEGYNLKIGMIYRPIEGLRIGAAFHSPTVVTLNTKYDARMWAAYEGSVASQTAQTPRQTFIEKFYTPARVLGGVSYMFGSRALLALDYECAWYNGMRVWGDLYDDYWDVDNRITHRERYKNDIKYDFTAAHTVRLGGEVMATDFLAARAGFSYTHEGLSDALRNGDSMFETPVGKSSMVVSAGLGYRFAGQASLDLTYAYSATAYTLYDPYYFQTTGGATFTMSDPVKFERSRHNIMLTFNYKF